MIDAQCFLPGIMGTYILFPTMASQQIQEIGTLSHWLVLQKAAHEDSLAGFTLNVLVYLICLHYYMISGKGVGLEDFLLIIRDL